MPIFQIARKLPQALRASIAALLLIFAINAIADAAHHHEPAAASVAHDRICGYCATFTNIAGAPQHCITVTAVPTVTVFITDPCFDVIAQRPLTTAQPRAPPFS